jgi:hypothetical protein
MRALLAQLPHGRTLPDASWRARHRALLVVLWAHVPGLALFAVHAGQAPAHALLDVAPVAVLALLGSMPRRAGGCPSRSSRSAC